MIGMLMAAAMAVQGATMPDFAGVTTTAAAKARVKTGELIAVHAFPRELGGPDDVANIVHVTPRAAARRAEVIAELRGLVMAGRVDTMDVQPEYRGVSVVPIRIVMVARGRGGAGDRSFTIAVW